MIKMFVYPKDGIKFFVSNIGDVMCMPNGHVNERGVVAIQVESEDLIGSDAAQLNACFAFDHCEAFGFAGVEMVASGDAGFCGTEAHLSSAVELHNFHKGAAVIGVELQVEGEEGFMVDVADKCIEEVTVERVVEAWENSLVKV